MPELVNVVRCPAVVADGECGSAVFYDWGIQLMEKWNGTTVIGNAERQKDWASDRNVKICARCTTPYVVIEGNLVDISVELTAEDVKAILSRGQATLPHPKIKDP